MQGKIPSFVKLPSNKRFNFKPRYYNAQKEELEGRIARAKRELAAEEAGLTDPESLKNKLSESWRVNHRRRVNQKANMRVAMIAAILFVIFYFYFMA